MRVNILLACTECKRRNYATKKFCPWCRTHTVHRETR